MKKLISILLVIILTFAFVGCNGKSKEAEVKVGKDQITIDKITYYNTGNIAEATPEESTIKEIEVSSYIIELRPFLCFYRSFIKIVYQCILYR